MTAGKGEGGPARKRHRFVLDDDGIEITGHHIPSAKEEAEAGRVFERILKNRRKETGR
jgi:hypothetical protein